MTPIPLRPIRKEVTGACEILGIDPLYVANEGKLIAVVSPDAADTALAALRSHPFGHEAAIIAEITPTPWAWSPWNPPSAAPASSTCSRGTRCRGFAE